MSQITGEEFYEVALEAIEDIVEDHSTEKRTPTAWVKLLLEKVQSNVDDAGDDDDDDLSSDDDDLPDDEG